MKITLRLFAIARQLADTEIVELELPQRATVADLRAEMARRFPSLAAIDRHLMFAINSNYVDDHAALAEGDDVACIPPVSGG